jgi:hypothetical protein
MFDLGVRTAHVAQFALEGALWAITPARMLTLVHAVQRRSTTRGHCIRPPRCDRPLQ